MSRKIHISTIIDDWKRMLLVMIFSSLICAMLGDMITYKTRKLIYRSEATLTVAARKGDTRYSMYTNLSATQQMAKTFSYIMSSDLIEDMIKEDLDVTTLNGHVETSVMDNTNILSLKVYGSSAEETFQMMQSVLNHYQELCTLVMPGAYVELLQTPLVPMAPLNPLSHYQNLMKAGVLSFLVFSLLVCFYSYMKDTIKTSRDVSEQLDMPLFCSVPYQKHGKKQRILVSDVRTSFSYVEAFKRMRVKIESSGHHVIMVTSARQNEGKSTVSANLALTLAKNKQRVLLLDLDLRNPSIARLFGYEPQHEILDVLEGKASLQDSLHYDAGYKLSFLLGRRSSDLAPDLLGSVKMRSIIQVMRRHYDYLVIDCPPVGHLSDALVISELADAILFVVKQNDASSKMINDAVDLLKESNPNVLGCVFNHRVKHDSGTASHYYQYGSYRSYYGYKKYGYGEYGKNEQK